MKRVFAVLALTAILLTGCAKVGKCESCGQKETLKKLTVAGETAWVCNDCYSLLKLFSSLG